MKKSQSLPAAYSILFALLAVAIAAQPAQAQAVPRVAVANLQKILSDSQEAKDLVAKFENDRRTFEAGVKERQGKFMDLKSQLEMLKPDAPSYAEKSKEFLNYQIESETWSKLQQANFQREFKIAQLQLFNKAIDAVQKVAVEKGIDVVMADQRPNVPQVSQLDQVEQQQLTAVLNARTLLYVKEPVDITPDVVARMDADYKAGVRPSGN